MLYALILTVHVLVCIVLILVVLLQAGRGGGFSDMMGGGQPQSLFGTQTNAFMMRVTEVCAVLFIVTSLSLGVLSTHKGRSLMERQSLVQEMPAVPDIPQPPQAPPKAPDTIAPQAPAAIAPAPVPESAPSPANAT